MDKPGDGDGSFSFRGPGDETQAEKPNIAAPASTSGDANLVSVGEVGAG